MSWFWWEAKKIILINDYDRGNKAVFEKIALFIVILVKDKMAVAEIDPKPFYLPNDRWQ